MRTRVPALFLAAAVAVLVVVSGAAVAAKARMATDSFDGATRVWIDPHGFECGMTMICPALGARWTSSDPEAAVLEVEVMNAYASISGAKLNIDGRFVDLEPLDDTTRFEHTGGAPGVAPLRQSQRGFLIPLELVQVILSARHVQVRVSTRDGFVDGVLVDGKKGSKAYGALERFWAKVPYRPAPTAPPPPGAQAGR